MAKKPKKNANPDAAGPPRQSVAGTPPLRGPSWNAKYDPKWCEQVVALGSEGMSRREIALELRIGKSTLYRYIETHPAFAEAMNEADFAAQAWWERQGRLGVNRGVQSFNAVAYQFQMKNRFKADYQDASKVEHDVGAGFLKFMDAARKGEFKTPKPEYPKAA